MAIKNLSVFLSLTMVMLGLISAATAQTRNISQEAAILNRLPAATGFGGAWRLNPDESDDVMKKMQENFAGSNDASLQVKSDAKQVESPALSVSLFPPETLSVATGDAPETEITINEGFKNMVLTRTIRADGSAQTYELRPGVNYAVTAFRKSGKIVIETVSPSGNRMIETYELTTAAPTGSKLSVTMRIEDASAKEMLTLHRVYDRAATDIFPADGEEEFQ